MHAEMLGSFSCYIGNRGADLRSGRGAAADVIESSSPVVAPPPSKKLRKGYAYEAVPINQEPPQPIKQVSPPKSKSTPKSESRSSFGRVRNNTKKSGYVYDKESHL